MMVVVVVVVVWRSLVDKYQSHLLVEGYFLRKIRYHSYLLADERIGEFARAIVNTYIQTAVVGP